MRNGIILALGLLFVASMAQAVTRQVPGEYDFIQDAIDACIVGDTVLVAVGTYDDVVHQNLPDTTRCVVVMRSGISLIGAGIGQTVIDARDLGRGISCSGVTDARIENLTVKNSFAATYGSGIYCRDGSNPEITSCEITECRDGGIICLASSPTISYCEITANENKEGGGIALEDGSSPHVSYCTITGNSAPSGGGIFMRSGSAPLIEHCVISDNFLNTINASGGGFGILASQPVIRNCEINRNSATGPGAVYRSRTQRSWS